MDPSWQTLLQNFLATQTRTHSLVLIMCCLLAAADTPVVVVAAAVVATVIITAVAVQYRHAATVTAVPPSSD